MTYNEINREGLETEIGRPLSIEEWDNFQREVSKFIENANPTQDEVNDFVMQLSVSGEVFLTGETK